MPFDDKRFFVEKIRKLAYYKAMSWDIDEEKPFFSIGAVAEIIGVKQRMLRLYEENGLLFPNRTQTNRRQYSLKDIAHIAYLNYLSNVKKVNLPGLVEIQDILTIMTQEQRQKFMEKIEKKIKNLPKEAKAKFSDPDEEDFNKVADEFSSSKPLKEELRKLDPN